MALAYETIAEIERIRAALPDRRSALLPALKVAQRERGWLPPETLADVAALLELDPNAAAMLASFYTMLHTDPVGRITLGICRSIVCYLRGSDDVVAAASRHLGITVGETTPDGAFTLHLEECLGDCPHAPMMRVNDDYVGQLNPATVGQVLDLLRERVGPPGSARGLLADPATGRTGNEGPLVFTNAIRPVPATEGQ